MTDRNLQELARDAHEAYPNDLSFPEVFSLLVRWKQRGLSMPRTTGERAWVEGLKQANQTLYREVMALISSRGE
jgi:hypothetical protein